MTYVSKLSPSEKSPVPARFCQNCRHPMEGVYCPACGQEDKEVKRPVIYFLQEFLRVVFELDGRAYRTLFTLISRPGFLTKEYFAGRRMKYTPPLRLFLVVSIGFFLLVSMFNNLQSMQLAMEDMGESNLGEQTETSDEENDSRMSKQEFEENFGDVIEFFAKLKIPLLSDTANQNLQVALSSQMRTNLKEVMADPEDFFFGSLEYITFFILLMMPILALIQQIFWVLSRRYFVEHLILTVHNHTFIILTIFVAMVLGVIDDMNVPVLNATTEILNILAAIWIFVYLYLSLKRYFGAGWLVTALLYLTTTAAYASVLSTGLFFFATLLVLFA